MKRTLLLAALTAFLLPAAAAAQACLGVPTVNGQFALDGSMAFPEGGTSYAITGTADLAGPFTVQANGGISTIDDVDENVTSFGANLAYELPGVSFSACPMAGVQYSTWGDEGFGVTLDLSQIMVPVGVGLGTMLAAGESMDLLVFAVPQFLYIRTTIEGSGFGDTAEETESDSEFGANLGARLVFGSLFVGGGVNFTTIEEQDPVFGLTAGFVFGGN